jgi:APA family basic amino acid/polyamine antiporter
LLSLLMISVVGCLIARNPAAVAANFGSATAFLGAHPVDLGFAAAFGAAMVGSLFSADAWASVTFTAAEIRNPRRDLPLALAIGTGVVILLYVTANLAYLSQLPVSGEAAGATVFARGISHAAGDRVASAAMQTVWGSAGASIIAVLVMISTFGCANGLILTGARVIYAMAHDGVFFPAAGRLNRASVPAFALIIQGVWASVLTLSGTYSELLDYVIFAQLMFYVVTVAAVFVLRMKRPDVARPYRAFGYPWIPIAYILAAGAMMVDLLIAKPAYTWPGVLIVLAGVPVYMLFARRGDSPAA